jgi:hypothetical protein
MKEDRWLYIIMVLCIGLILVSLFEMHSLGRPTRVLVDNISIEEDDGFIRTYNFVGVEEKNIIFEVTERGD